MKIKYNKEVGNFLIKEKGVDFANYVIDCAVYYAEQNVDYRAQNAGFGWDEMVYLADKKVKEIINETFGNKEFFHPISGAKINYYCEKSYR